MNIKRKKMFFELFYKEFKMPDKMNYIKKVMESCVTDKQLDSTLAWGVKVLWQNCSAINNHLDQYDCGTLSISYTIIDRTEDLADELKRYYDELSERLHKVVI